MAISIDWPSGVISVPQADLTPVTGTLYELDVDAFRLELKNLEDSDEGMAWPRTHRHNTEVVIAGITYARTVEIINGYSVQFENGLYSVRLSGANTNIFDIQNGILVQNQVQVIPTNSAGLIKIVQGSGLSTEQAAALTRILDLIEADETHTPSQITRYAKGTAVELQKKDITGSSLTTPITIVEAAP